MLRVSAVRNFLPRETTLYQLMDLLAYGSAGHASYLVYKYGGGFSNSGTAVALLLYGGVLVQDAGYDLRAANDAWRTDAEVLQQLFHHYAFRSLTTLALANTYLIIYEEAGCWMLPLAISSLFKMFVCTLFAEAAH
ncbi:Protein C41G7.9 a [Aphelenchoides avenae]|nr:Protein C41G7.9 a [Aphelenchus avenae]